MVYLISAVANAVENQNSTFWRSLLKSSISYSQQTLLKSGSAIGPWHSAILYGDGNNAWKIEYNDSGVRTESYDSDSAEKGPKLITSVELGVTSMNIVGVRGIVKELEEKFNSDTYDLMTNNCHDFCYELSYRILGKNSPKIDYLRNLTKNAVQAGLLFTKFVLHLFAPKLEIMTSEDFENLYKILGAEGQVHTDKFEEK